MKVELSPLDCIKLGKLLTNFYPRILPAVEVIKEASRLGQGNFSTADLEVSNEGHVIKLMRSKSTGEDNALWYGFADPGEAVGATGMLCLMKGLIDGVPALSKLPYVWNFIPVLNLDDQPNGGNTLQKVMKTGEQEVDWMVKNPRPETKALLRAAKDLRPKFVFPLHDEWHCREQIPCYMPVSGTLPRRVCDGLREILLSFGLEISKKHVDAQMGEGFLNWHGDPESEHSTFFEFSKHGFVFICEVPDIAGKEDRDVIAAQLAAGLFAMANC